MRASCSVILPSALESHRRTAEFKAKTSESFSVRWLLTMRGIKKVVVFSLRSRDSGDLVKASEVHHACPFMLPVLSCLKRVTMEGNLDIPWHADLSNCC